MRESLETDQHCAVQWQPLVQARIKDHRVEGTLPKLVCADKISLSDAQKCVATIG